MTTNTAVIPSWVRSELFEKILTENVKDFRRIENFKICPALAPGENYATVMLKVHINCLLATGQIEKITFMLKVPHDNELYRNELIKWDMFATEHGMYREIVPEFENLFRQRGIEVRFGATAYELPVKEEYILLEDLTRRGFCNVQRQNCLDVEHCRGVLKKLAQFHAASAVWVEHNGPFPKIYQPGMIRKESMTLLKPMLISSLEHVLKAVKHLENADKYHEKLQYFGEHLEEALFQQGAKNEHDFLVLNHGDCWANNIMFQYNPTGELQETYFVDLQLPAYGTPAQDLLYFLISSAQLDLKVNRFDEMVRYYYDNLIENLKILEYGKSLPRLRDLHQMLLRGSIWGIIALLVTMAAVLCESTNEASIDNLTNDTPESQKFKELLYTNERFLQHLNAVLPWLFDRGAFDI
uniref:CHK kinase-like domain-containing protein n=1 Tax=Musca domestica TaxID=7370 RepID=A0A1I8MYS3_MUSDO